MADPGTTYVLKQKLASLSGDAWIEDDQGRRLFEVDGKAFRLRRTVLLKDPSGVELYQISKSLMHVHRTFEIKRGDTLVATLQQGLVSFLGDKITVKFETGDELKVKGDILDHDFTIKRGGDVVVSASRKFFSLHNSYGVRVADGMDADIALAMVIALEQMEEEDNAAHVQASSS
jgi:uncharacterized protein YxjI